MADDRIADGQATRGPFIDGPDAEGFYGIRFEGPGFAPRFGRYLARGEGDGRSRVRLVPGEDAGNINGLIHGGYTLGFLDQAIFVGPATIGLLDPGRAVTLSIATQFVGAGQLGKPLDCVVDVVRQTRQLLFLSGVMEQADATIFSFQATLRTFDKRRGDTAGEGGAA